MSPSFHRLRVAVRTPTPFDPGAAARPWCSASESGTDPSETVLSASGPPLRREVAGLILSILNEAYGPRLGYVRGEARRRGLTVEGLMAGYLARKVMDKVEGVEAGVPG